MTVVGTLVVFSGLLILIGVGGDDQVPAGLRGRHLQDAGRHPPADCGGAGVEYGLLGLLAGGIGAGGAIGLSWAISRYALDIPFRPLLGTSAIGVAVTAVLVAAIGVISSWEVLQRKPLATLAGRVAAALSSRLSTVPATA